MDIPDENDETHYYEDVHTINSHNTQTVTNPTQLSKSKDSKQYSIKEEDHSLKYSKNSETYHSISRSKNRDVLEPNSFDEPQDEEEEKFQQIPTMTTSNDLQQAWEINMDSLDSKDLQNIQEHRNCTIWPIETGKTAVGVHPLARTKNLSNSRVSRTTR